MKARRKMRCSVETYWCKTMLSSIDLGQASSFSSFIVALAISIEGEMDGICSGCRNKDETDCITAIGFSKRDESPKKLLLL